MPRVGARDGVDGTAGLHRVGAAAAVDMQVDEAGQHDRQPTVAPCVFGDRLALHGNDAARVVRKPSAQPTPRREDQPIDRAHSNGRSLACAK